VRRRRSKGIGEIGRKGEGRRRGEGKRGGEGEGEGKRLQMMD